MAAQVKFKIVHIRAHGNCDLFFGVAGYSFGIQLLEPGISILSFFGRVIRETDRHF